MAKTRPNRPHTSRKSTMADVARAAGVALSTVSRVLNNHTEGFSVKPEIRKRILAQARELDYRPNPVIRSLRAKRTNIIALLGINVGSPNPGVEEHACRSLIHVLNEAGYELCTSFVTQGQSTYDMPPWRVDGVVVLGASSPADIEQVEDSGRPYVSVNGYAGKNSSSVNANDPMGTRLAIDHLVGLGHRRIAYANATLLPDHHRVVHPSLRLREQAYLKAMRAHGLEPVPGHDQLHLGRMELLEMAMAQRATAILAYDHIQAIRILKAARTKRLRVPDDFSLMCFNDEFGVDEVTPRLTCVGLPAETMGQQAAELLIRQLQQQQPIEPTQILLDEHLVIRDSTAALGGAV